MKSALMLSPMAASASAVVFLYFAAYPTLRSKIFVEDIVINDSLRESVKTIVSKWCVPYDGIYDVSVLFPTTVGKDIVGILGRGGITPSGDIVQKGVDLSIAFSVSQGEHRYALDASRVRPIANSISRSQVGRSIGRMSLNSGCYESETLAAKWPKALEGMTASMKAHLHEPTNFFGKMMYRFFSFSDWGVAAIYRAGLRPLFWIGFIFFIVPLIFRIRKFGMRGH